MNEIAESYLDVWGKEKKIDPAVREALARAMGPARKPAKVRVEGGRCYEPEIFARGARVWGFGVQLYGLRSGRNWGIGDCGDLRALVELAAKRGAAVVGVNPLHATRASPYSPTSRHALNFLYLDIEAIPEYERCAPARKLVRSAAFQKRLQALREAELVDYAGVAKAKLQVLELLFKEAGPRQLLKRKGERDFALFEALREEHGEGWQNWPAKYHDPQAAAVKSFAKKNWPRVSFHEYVQWSTRAQLNAVQRHAHELGMPIGIYVDLALGADRGGAEVWSDKSVFAVEATCGAPPDEFNPKGQDWGLPPYAPRALRAAAYRPFTELRRGNRPEGAPRRTDHVMQL